MKYGKFLGVLLAFFISSSVQASKLTVVADEWPPFSGSELTENGLSPHVISAVLERAGYDVEVKILPWARIMHGARNGEFDMVGSLFYDAELTEFMDYSDPYYETEIKFLKPKDSELEYTDLESLGTKRIAVGDGFLYSPEFDDAGYLNKVVTTTTLQCVQMVAFDRADLTLDSVEVLNYTIDNLAPELKDKVELVTKPLDSQAMYMAISKNTPDYETILRNFNSTLEAMKQDGSYEAIIHTHTR